MGRVVLKCSSLGLDCKRSQTSVCVTEGLLALLTASSRTSARYDSENLVLAHDQQLFAVNLDFRAAVFAKEDPVALLNIQGLAGSVFLVFSFSGRDYFAFLRFFFRAVRDDDAAANLLAFVNALYNHAVM